MPGPLGASDRHWVDSCGDAFHVAARDDGTVYACGWTGVTGEPGAVWLDRDQVTELRDWLDAWLDETDTDAELCQTCAQDGSADYAWTSDTVELTEDGEPVHQFTHGLDGKRCVRSRAGRWLAAGYGIDPDAECHMDHDETLAQWERELLDAGEDANTVLDDAKAAVYGARQADYGHPREDFTRTAILWTGLLQHLLADGAYLEAADIARCMIAVKLSRDVHSPLRDNRVDMAGYAATLDRLETGQ